MRRRIPLSVLPVVFVVVVAACASRSASTSSTTSRTAVPTSSSTATAATTATATSPTTATTTATTVNKRVSFSKDVLPILQNNCASCHTANGPGIAHLDLTTAEGAAARAVDISGIVSARAMPPWPAGSNGLKFKGDRRLTDAELATIGAWEAEGSSLDVPASTPITPTKRVVTPLRRDTVIKGQPYKGSTALSDEYRCQIYDPKLSKPSFLQGMDLEPDQTRVVHHGLLFHGKASTREQAEAIDAAQPGSGWTCFGLPALGNGPGEDLDQIMSWGPGQAPSLLPADTAVAMEAGDYFIMQIHYHYQQSTEQLPPDESSLVLDFADDATVAAAGGTLAPVSLTLYLGPAEIPCTSDQVGPLCDRSAAVAKLVESYGPAAAFIADGLVAGCGATVADFAGMTSGVASARCDHPARPGEIISIWGHEHELGTTFRMTLNPGKPDEKVLLDIPNWAFEWQLNYSPVDKVVIKPGDTIRVECSWDRSRADAGKEPRYIAWAEGTNDEMCFSQIITRPPT
jgi:mono/diheme cytochrome c family protein